MGSFIFLVSYHDRFWFKIKWNDLHLSLLLPTTASRWQQTLPPSSVLVCLLITNKYTKLHGADDIWLKWTCSSLKTTYWRCYHKLHMSYTLPPMRFFFFFISRINLSKPISRYLSRALPVGVRSDAAGSCLLPVLATVLFAAWEPHTPDCITDGFTFLTPPSRLGKQAESVSRCSCR